MPYQEISATVTDQKMQAVKDAITAVQTALPFLISLTEAERKQLRKTGASRLAFVQNAAQAAQDNPNILPASFDEDGFQSNVALFTAMTEINTLAAQLASQIDDTHLAVGVEALSGASDVYNYVKAAPSRRRDSSRWPTSWVNCFKRVSPRGEPTRKPRMFRRARNETGLTG